MKRDAFLPQIDVVYSLRKTSQSHEKLPFVKVIRNKLAWLVSSEQCESKKRCHKSVHAHFSVLFYGTHNWVVMEQLTKGNKQS